MSLAPGDKLV